MNELEILPNEIILWIFSYLLWDEILESFWLLNARFTEIVRLWFSLGPHGIYIKETGFSYKRFSSKLYPLITNSPSLISSIRRIYLDGKNSNCYYFFNDDNRHILRYPNLQSLIFTECYLTKILIENLSMLVENQLKELVLTLDTYIFEECTSATSPLHQGTSAKERLLMFKNFLGQLFSNRCQLTFLFLDLPQDNTSVNIQGCLSSTSIERYSISNDIQDHCTSLRCVHIRLSHTCFLHHLIQHVPNLECLSICFRSGWSRCNSGKFNHESINTWNEAWSTKVPKLKSLRVKCFIQCDFQLAYLKWIINGLNHVQQLKLHLNISIRITTSKLIHESLVDANFICKYILSDTILNLIDFDFYIIFLLESIPSDVERIINSFNTHPVFIKCQCSNVKCFIDKINAYQYIWSSMASRADFFQGFKNHLNVFKWSTANSLSLKFSLYPREFFEEFNKSFPHITGINSDTDYFEYHHNSIPYSEFRHDGFANVQLRYVTRIDLGPSLCRNATYQSNRSTSYNRERSIILAHLLSLPDQLKYLRIHHFDWLMHIVQYAASELRKDILNTVKYVEFCVYSCHLGANAAIRTGEQLVPFLGRSMPRLETLRIWRQDDFPWTSVRPDFQPARNGTLTRRWLKILQTPESIEQHTAVFEHDLQQLVEQLKNLTFLDIHGKISADKVKYYQLMVQKAFPNSHFSISESRFCLWI